jgi:hypothetical protein
LIYHYFGIEKQEELKVVDIKPLYDTKKKDIGTSILNLKQKHSANFKNDNTKQKSY